MKYTKLQKNILRVLKEKEAQVEFSALSSEIKKTTHNKEFCQNFDGKLLNHLFILRDAGLVDIGEIENVFKDQFNREIGTIEDSYIRLTYRGLEFFDPWYLKAWRFFTEDLAKILSVIAIIISILVGLAQIGLSK